MATSAFGKAFRAAREAGDTEFEFGGKKYNTKMKDEPSASSKPSKTDVEALEAKGQAGNEAMKNDEVNSSKEKTAPTKKQETYRDLSGKIRYKEEVKPPSEYEWGPQNIPRNIKNTPSDIMSGLKTVGSAVGDYVSNFETPAERRSREAKQGSGMKKGGSVSSASSRGDGIAQRGKTRGKMC